MLKLWACVNDVINELKCACVNDVINELKCACTLFLVHDGVKPADHTALKNVVRFISAFVKSFNEYME